MGFARQGLTLTQLIRLRLELEGLGKRAAAAGRQGLAGSCDATAAEISQWIDDAMPAPRSPGPQQHRRDDRPPSCRH